VCSWGILHLCHSFLLVSETPIPLLGRDLLSKLKVHILLPPREYFCMPLIEEQVDHLSVWMDGSTIGRGHTQCFFPPQQKSVWLDWKLGSTSPESSSRFPLPTWPPLNLLLRRLTNHASPFWILNFSLRRLHQESNLCQISSPTSSLHSISL
jgi:hypothetical protein